MKAQVEIEIAPFTTPNFVRQAKQPDGYSPTDDGEAIPLSACDSETLEKLCDDFRAEVFKKAGKSRPPIAVCACGNRA